MIAESREGANSITLDARVALHDMLQECIDDVGITKEVRNALKAMVAESEASIKFSEASYYLQQMIKESENANKVSGIEKIINGVQNTVDMQYNELIAKMEANELKEDERKTLIELVLKSIINKRNKKAKI